MVMELFVNRTAFILAFVIEKPLMYTYLHGGTLFGLGGHGGRPENEICSILTDVPSKHWELHPDECTDLINTKIRSLEVLCAFVAYMALLTLIVWKGYTRAIAVAESVGSTLIAGTWNGLQATGRFIAGICSTAWNSLFGTEDDGEDCLENLKVMRKKKRTTVNNGCTGAIVLSD